MLLSCYSYPYVIAASDEPGLITYCSRIHAHILMMKYQLNILQAGHLCHVTIFIIVEVSTLIRSYPDRL